MFENIVREDHIESVCQPRNFLPAANLGAIEVLFVRTSWTGQDHKHACTSTKRIWLTSPDPAPNQAHGIE